MPFRRHILIRIISIFPAILCAIAITAWIRSYFSADAIEWDGAKGRVGIMATRGSLGVFWDDAAANRPEDIGWDTVHWFKTMNMKDYILDISGTAGTPGTHWAWGGIGYCHDPEGSNYRLVGFPIWPFALILGLCPIIAFRRHKTPTTMICPKCSYDLRATPDRCPECGTEVAEATRKKSSATENTQNTEKSD